MIDETVEDIEEMQTHASSAVAIKAAGALRELLERDYPTVEEYVRDLDRNSSALRRANTSHASLHNTQRRIVGAVQEGDHETVEDAKAATERAIDEVVEDVRTAKEAAARNAVEFLPDGTTVLTHDYSSTVLEAIEYAARDGCQVDVYVTEARPRFLGRKTARTLAGVDRVDTSMIVDGAAGHYLEECDRVMIGMDCIVDDTLYNRVGTFPIAAAAAELSVPVTVVGAGAKIIEEGFAFENDFRSSSEVMREPAEGFTILNPAYDATPMRLLQNVVTDDGVHEL